MFRVLLSCCFTVLLVSLSHNWGHFVPTASVTNSSLMYFTFFSYLHALFIAYLKMYLGFSLSSIFRMGMKAFPYWEKLAGTNDRIFKSMNVCGEDVKDKKPGREYSSGFFSFLLTSTVQYISLIMLVQYFILSSHKRNVFMLLVLEICYYI